MGSRATEVWIPDQTSGAQAPCFGGLLGLADRTASRSERFEANRRRRLLGRDRAYARRSGRMRLTGEGSKAASVWPQTKRIGAGRLPQRCAAFWVPDQNAPARGFLAQARSAANAATAARRTPQEGRQCPPLVRTPPASLVRQSDRAPGACCFGFPTKTTPFASRAFSPKRAYARRSGRMRLTG